MLAQEAWTTGNTLTVISIGVAIVGIAVGYLYANPRRRLHYGMPRVTRLLAASHNVKDLEIRHRGVLLEDPPYVVEIRLASRGRRDIPIESFTRDEPLRLDLGVPILEVLKKPPMATTPPPKAVVDGTELQIGPDLISKRCGFTYTLLVSERPTLTAISRLVDVQVRETGDSESMRRAFVGAFLMACSMMVAIATAVVAGLLSPRSTFAVTMLVIALGLILLWLAAAARTVPLVWKRIIRRADRDQA